MECERYTIIVKVDRVARLFHSLDPTPFRERDLDPEAERFIVEWAKDAPRSAQFEITIQIPEQEAGAEAILAIRQAVRYNFQDRDAGTSRELRELLREGRRELLVGVPILALSMAASQFIMKTAGPATLARVFSESLLIFGWVANWRPLEIFLYDWWSVALRRRLYRRLAAAEVKVAPL